MKPRRGRGRGRAVAVPSSSSSLEQLWIDEVRYLHSLWHQGPPRNPNDRSNSNPKPTITTNNNSLGTSNSTHFKKETGKKTRRGNRGARKKKKKAKMETETSTPPVPEVEWPCEPVRDLEKETGWPELDAQPGSSSIKPISAEDQAIIAALQLQQKGLKASQEFLSRHLGSDDEDEEVQDDDEDDVGDDDFMEDDDEEEEESETEEFKFFLGFFTEDIELRSYYEKNFENGEFCCLVCGLIGKKRTRRFKNCLALVQHSTAISKTKQRRAHRAFGEVVCQVLGWDIKRLPSIVLSANGTLSRQLLAQANPQVGQEEIKDKTEDSRDTDIKSGELNEQLAGSDTQVRDEETRDIIGDSSNVDTGVSKLNISAGVSEQNADVEGGEQNEKLVQVDSQVVYEEFEDKTEETVNADDRGGAGGEQNVELAQGDTQNDPDGCLLGTQENDGNDQSKDSDKEIVDTVGANCGDEIVKLETGAESGHKSIHEENVDLEKFIEELVNCSG